MPLHLVFVVLLAGCSSNDKPEGVSTTAEAPTTTTTQATEDATVRVVAQIVGLGCTRTAPVGNGSQLVILDPTGKRLGIGTFELSPGLTPGVDTCDWTAVVPGIDASHDLYVLEGDGAELVTVDLGAEGWSVELAAGLDGVRLRT